LCGLYIRLRLRLGISVRFCYIRLQASAGEITLEESCLPPVSEPKRPDIPCPQGACDAHFHIFGPLSRFPYADSRAYTPPEAPLEALLRLHARLGIERGVVVQGNAHGTDNTAILDAVSREPHRLRAVAIVGADTGPDQLKTLARSGVRALRFHHQPRQGGTYSSLGFGAFEKLAPHMAELGLHVQFFMDARALPDLMPRLENWKLPVVLDHFGSTRAAEGTAAAGFQTLKNFLAQGRIWVKTSGAYRASEQYPDYPDARALHEALVAANPDQLLWGTDWPHPRLASNMPDDGHLLDLFNTWTPDAVLRKKILVDNPARLYGF
jgi:2-pyrone-4,6-dicarboxylate lactonase